MVVCLDSFLFVFFSFFSFLPVSLKAMTHFNLNKYILNNQFLFDK
jgi:hypothetical protein